MVPNIQTALNLCYYQVPNCKSFEVESDEFPQRVYFFSVIGPIKFYSGLSGNVGSGSSGPYDSDLNPIKVTDKSKIWILKRELPNGFSRRYGVNGGMKKT